MIKIFTIPFSKTGETFYDDHVNKFLLNKHVNNIKAEFFESKGSFYWSVFVDCDQVIEEKKRNVKIKLSEKDELLLKRLKEWRKQRAEKEGIPVFIIANNSELLSIVSLKPGSKEGIKQVRGFGTKKIEKYGDDILQVVSNFR